MKKGNAVVRSPTSDLLELHTSKKTENKEDSNSGTIKTTPKHGC